MTKKANMQVQDMPDFLQHTQHMYFSAAGAIGAELCHFMSQRVVAYAHIIEDFSHCHNLEEAWRLESDFSQQTFNAYSDETAKLSEIMIQAANGDAGSTAH